MIPRKMILLIGLCYCLIAAGQAAPVPDTATRVLLINICDGNDGKARKKKLDLFAELADSLKSYLAESIRTSTAYEPVIIPVNYAGIADRDSLALALMKEMKAGRVIFISYLDVFFENSGESIDRDAEGKRKKTIRYDMCTTINYLIYRVDGRKNELTVRDCTFFTDRNSTGSFSFQFGPDLLGKKKHTYPAVRRNAEKFVNQEWESVQ